MEVSKATNSTGGISVSEFELLVQYLKYASTFPDFPPNFIPPGFTDPSYVPPYKGTPLMIVNCISIGLAVIIVTSRIFVRMFWRGNRTGADDWTMVLATVCQTEERRD
jgi:hypothetical protein